MPGTGRYIARAEPAVSTVDASRPKYPPSSFRMGAYYLLRMIERSGGNLMYALASYNAGPGNVRAAGGIPDIPETQAYVPRVIDFYRQLGGVA